MPQHLYTGSSGRVVIEFDVDATKTVSQVGAGCIVLQEKNSSGKWTNVAYYYPVDYPDMVAYNRSSHEGSVTYYGTVGNQYRGIVTVYAKDANGEDSRDITTYAVRARK